MVHMTMIKKIKQLLCVGLAFFLLSAPCAFAKSEPVGDNATEGMAEPINLGTPNAPNDPSLAMATASSTTDSLASFGPSSGTVVGNRAVELRDEVLRLRSSVNLNSNQFAILRSSGAAGAVQYHSTVAAITARLQNGTTRGNPILLRQWEEADSSLGEVTTSLNRLNSLQTAVDADASVAAYLLESIQAAFQLSGAVDEDHDQLKLLKDEGSRLVVQLDYLRNQTSADIQRQANYLTTERANLQALAFAISRGELLGSSLANRPVIVTQPTMQTMPAPYGLPSAPVASPSMPVTQGMMTAPAPQTMAAPQPMSPRDIMQENGTAPAAPPVAPTAVGAQSANASAIAATTPPTVGRLLVLIRYNQPNVDYQQQLSQAVGTAIERRPNAEFSVVAVSPSSGDSAELAKEQEIAATNAEDVKRSLVQLGLQPSHISMASTQTQSAQTPEVHVYIR